MIRCIIFIAAAFILSEGSSKAGDPHAGKPPVLLVHGFQGSPQDMRSLGDFLKKDGRSVSYVTLNPNDGSETLESLALEVKTKVTQLYGSQPFDLVAFSMGGLVSRYYLEMLGGSKQVSHLVLISTPNHGTLTAFLNNNPGCIEMRPKSQFLDLLNNNLDKLQTVHCSCLFTPLDLMIIPAESSKISGWKTHYVWVLAHPLMLRSNECYRIIEEYLSSGRVPPM